MPSLNNAEHMHAGHQGDALTLRLTLRRWHCLALSPDLQSPDMVLQPDPKAAQFVNIGEELACCSETVSKTNAVQTVPDDSHPKTEVVQRVPDDVQLIAQT